MNKKRIFGLILITLATVTSVVVFTNGAVTAKGTGTSFQCENVYGTPTITATSSDWNNESRQFIRWTSDVGKNAGYTRLKRCQEVAGRLQSYFAAGSNYINYGVMNNNPVICTTDRLGNGCQQLLFTLDYRDYGTQATEARIDPKLVLEDLFLLTDRKFAGRPLRQAPCRTYIDIKAVLAGKTKIAQEVCNAR